jgi:hypothetical protein
LAQFLNIGLHFLPIRPLTRSTHRMASCSAPSNPPPDGCFGAGSRPIVVPAVQGRCPSGYDTGIGGPNRWRCLGRKELLRGMGRKTTAYSIHKLGQESRGLQRRPSTFSESEMLTKPQHPPESEDFLIRIFLRSSCHEPFSIQFAIELTLRFGEH